MEKIADRKKSQAFYYNRGSQELKSLRPQQQIRMKLHGQTRWSRGICLGKCGSRSYDVEVEGQVYRRNRRHLLDADVSSDSTLRESAPNEGSEAALPQDMPVSPSDTDFTVPVGNDIAVGTSPSPEWGGSPFPLRRSSRVRKQTDFYKCS